MQLEWATRRYSDMVPRLSLRGCRRGFGLLLAFWRHWREFSSFNASLAVWNEEWSGGSTARIEDHYRSFDCSRAPVFQIRLIGPLFDCLHCRFLELLKSSQDLNAFHFSVASYDRVQGHRPVGAFCHLLDRWFGRNGGQESCSHCHERHFERVCLCDLLTRTQIRCEQTQDQIRKKRTHRGLQGCVLLIHQAAALRPV